MRSRIPYYLVAAGIVFFGWQKYRQKIEASSSGEFPAAAAEPPERSEDQWCSHMR